MAKLDTIEISFHLTAYYMLPSERAFMNEASVTDFSLIHGYLSSESNFHYAVLAGWDSEHDPVWVLTYSELPKDAVIIPIECAERMIDVLLNRERTHV